MNKKTLCALRGSIKKWEAILSKKGQDDGHDNCPLCKLFHQRGSDCPKCPVALVSSRTHCIETPYERWMTHHGNVHHPWQAHNLSVQCPACSRIAKAELRFLKSLLPKEKSCQ